MADKALNARSTAPDLHEFVEEHYAPAYFHFRRVGLNGEASLALAAAGLTPTTVAALEAERAAEKAAS